MVNDVLFELGCEELPSASVWPLADALSVSVLASLKKSGIQHGNIQIFATPRRFGFCIKDMPLKQPEQKISRKGPSKAAAYADNKPTAALTGFAQSCGVTVEALSEVETEKGTWIIYEAIKPGLNIDAWLPPMIKDALNTLPIAKPMRWGNGEWEFVRPVHWAVLMYGEKIMDLSLFGIQTGNRSYGHRFHHPEAIVIQNPSRYAQQLEHAQVVVDFVKRRQMIKEQINALAQPLNAEALMPDALLDEVTSIVEWPQAMMVDFDPLFLQVPKEALIASMQSHQKCFALRDQSGKLLPRFITISNIESTDPDQVIAGNAKVMHARLSDAAFFYNQDLKQPLSSLIPRTEKVIFQKRLGTLHDKSLRIQSFMEYLASMLPVNEKEAVRAAQLSKCDLLTGMVGEFPELQGLMGYYYARHDGESEHVASALNEQYLPRFANDVLPHTMLGQLLSLSDRLDTLTGIFAIGEKPGGVKDPFKLRRHALAVARILSDMKEPLELSELLTEAFNNYPDFDNANTIIPELKHFILERLQSFYLTQDISADLVQAVRARQDENLSDFSKRIYALKEFVKTPASASLSAASKRVNNILQHAACENGQIQESLFREEAESDLYLKICQVQKAITPLMNKGDYQAVLQQLASLKDPVDLFFDAVMVMIDDTVIRMNRLLLLFELKNLLQGVADISLLSSV